jgi:hypothetical protein
MSEKTPSQLRRLERMLELERMLDDANQQVWDKPLRRSIPSDVVTDDHLPGHGKDAAGVRGHNDKLHVQNRRRATLRD